MNILWHFDLIWFLFLSKQRNLQYFLYLLIYTSAFVTVIVTDILLKKTFKQLERSDVTESKKNVSARSKSVKRQMTILNFSGYIQSITAMYTFIHIQTDIPTWYSAYGWCVLVYKDCGTGYLNSNDNFVLLTNWILYLFSNFK